MAKGAGRSSVGVERYMLGDEEKKTFIYIAHKNLRSVTYTLSALSVKKQDIVLLCCFFGLDGGYGAGADGAVAGVAITGGASASKTKLVHHKFLQYRSSQCNNFVTMQCFWLEG